MSSHHAMDPHLRVLYEKVKQLPNRAGTQNNPFVSFIEALYSHNKSLLERVDGEYRLFPGGSPDDPDVLLMDSKTAADIEKHLLPSPPSLLTRATILQDYELLYNLCKDNKAVTIRQTIRISPPHFTRSPLESLTPILILNMLLHKVHKGQYLVCRTISRVVRMVAIQVAVEDQDGTVADLALYNCFDTAGLGRTGVAGIMPIGQTILVREPWFKLGATGGNPTIRIDTPSDVSLLASDHPILRSLPDNWRAGPSLDPEAYKAIGNEAFKKKDFEAAIRAYTTGLAIDPSASLLRLNRSLCHMKLGNLSLAMNDARMASEDEALPENSRYKARYRMAAIYYAMDRFTEALQVLEDRTIAQFSPEDYQKLLKMVQDRLVEQAQGNYDWFSLSKLADQINGKHQIADVADYMGPVKVVQMSEMGGGRGLVTTRPVLAGELLVVSKPFAFASPLEFSELLRELSLERGNITEKAYHEVVGRAARRLMGDHTAASALFLDLYPGKDYNPLPTTETNLSSPTFLANGAHHWTISGENAIPDIDINKIEGIIASNSFADHIKNHTVGKTEAIYTLPSLINHSCHGTAVRSNVGSVVVIRACRDMKEGEEVTCSYIAIGEHTGATYLSREPALKKWFSTCRCELCSSDRQDGDARCRERERYDTELAGIRMQLNPANTQLATTILELVRKIRSTYGSERNGPMDVLGLAQRVLAFMSQVQGPRQSIQGYTDALRSHGIRVKDSPPKRAPRNRSEMRRSSLIIETSSFPSQLDHIFRCIKVMTTLSSLEYQRGKYDLASHWAVACLWTHEAFYGPGKTYLWQTLKVEDNPRSPHVLVELLKGFE